MPIPLIPGVDRQPAKIARHAKRIMEIRSMTASPDDAHFHYGPRSQKFDRAVGQEVTKSERARVQQPNPLILRTPPNKTA